MISPPYVQASLGIDGTLSKPDPALFHQLCADLDVAPEHTLMVGDGGTDIKMGQAAGAAGCIQVTWGWPSPVSLGSVKPDVTISAWDQLQVIS